MKKLYVNVDINSKPFPFLEKLSEQERITEDMLYPFVDVYRLTGATDILINVYCMFSGVKSEFLPDYREIMAGRENWGDRAFFYRTWEGLYNVQENHGIDVYGTWIDRCRQVGLNPWISIRMNDCHGSSNRKSLSKKDLFEKALAEGWVLGEDYGYYKTCYDYSVKEVRDRMLGYIRELVTKYDPYGLELDFLREYHCFRYLTANMDECREIMVGFIRDVRAILDERGEVYGHRIKILMRVPRDVAHCYYYGFDIERMAKEGLIDVVNASPRFTASESGIDVDEWRRALPGVEIIPGLDGTLGLVGDNRFCTMLCREMIFGLAANYLSYDPEGLYVYNCFISPHMFWNMYTPLCKTEQYILDDCDEVLRPEPGITMRLMNLIAITNYDMLQNSALRFVIIPEAFEACAGYPKMWRPLPAEIGAEPTCLDIRTGVIKKGKKCSVIVGFEGGHSDFEASLNGCKLDGFEVVDLRFLEGIGYQPDNCVTKNTVCYRAKFDEDILTAPTQKLEVRSDRGDLTLTWAEINVY